MARLPDRFDLWVRKARACADPERQLDYVLGALIGLLEWHFLNVGTLAQPQPAETELEAHQYLLLFSDAGRIEEILAEAGLGNHHNSPPVISVPTSAAILWCLELRSRGYEGLLINPGEDAVLISFNYLDSFYQAWKARGGRESSGFWIPNLTSEEEDFWQENGL